MARNTENFTQEPLPEVTLPPLNITPTVNGSVVSSGELASPNYRARNSGWKADSQGNFEAQNGVFNGTFTIGGTSTTIDSVEKIQSTINDIANSGGGTVYLAAGTYLMSSNIDIPSNVVLAGSIRDGTIIDFQGQAYSVRSIGSNSYTTGTVSVNDGSSTVTGAGVTWTTAMIGRTIFLNDLYFTILNVSGGNTITLDSAYSGPNLSGSTYAIATATANWVIRDVTIQNSSTSAIKAQYCYQATIDNVNTYDSAIGIDLDNTVALTISLISAIGNTTNIDFNYSYSWTLDNAFVNNSTNNGFVLSNSGNATCFNTGIDNSGADGINLTSCSNIAFVSLTVSRCGGQGIEFVSSNSDIQLISSTIDGNTSDGIKLTATTDRVSISTCSIINNGGYGINIAASTCDNNYIVAPSYSNNSSGTLSDSGTLTVIIQETDQTNDATLIAGEALSTGDAVYISDGSEVNTDDSASTGSESQTSDDGTLSISGVNWVAQTFQVSQDFFPSSVQLKYQDVLDLSTTGSVSISIRATAAGIPTGADLATATATGLGDGVTSVLTFTFSSLVRLSASTTYAIVMKGPAVPYLVYVDTTSPSYTNGQFATSSNSGGTWTADSSKDAYFVVNYTTARISGRVYKTDASFSTVETTNFIGFNDLTVSRLGTATVHISGRATLSGLTVGKNYYLSDTAGAISTTPGTNTVNVGISLSTTSLLIKH